MTGNVFLDFEPAFRILASEQAVGLAMDTSVAFGARRFQVRERPVNDFVSELACLFNDVRRQILDLVHERITIEVALFDLLQFEFPLASHFRRAKIGDPDFMQQVDQCQPFVRDYQIAFLQLMAEDIFLADQILNDRGTSRRSSQSTFAHRITQFIVVDSFSCRLHRRQQRTIVVSRWRTGFVFLQLDFDDLGGLTICGGNQFVLVTASSRRPAVNFQITGNHENFTSGQETILLDPRDTTRQFIFRMRIEDRQKTTQYQLVNLQCSIFELCWRNLSRWNNRKVIADFRSVEDSFRRADSIVVCHPLRASSQ